MNQRSILIIIVAAVVVAVAAYLIFTGSRPTPAPSPTATPTGQAAQTTPSGAAMVTPESATTPAGEATPTTAPSGAETPITTGTGTAGLNAALLTLEDMPANWSVRTEEPPADTAPISFLCRNITRRSGEVVRAAFHRRQDIGPIVRSSVALYAPGDAEAFMADLQAAVADCTQWQVETSGRQVSWEATPVALEQLGDQMIAVRAKTSGEVSFGQVSNGFVYIRIGNYIASISTTAVNADVFGIGGLPDDHLERFSRLVAERLRAVASAQP